MKNNDKYDVFISYRRNGGFNIARLLLDRLEQNGLKVFFDIEELSNGKFNEKLYSTIENCSNFVIILSVGALDRCKNEGDWVRLEIEHALKSKLNIVPIAEPGFEWPDNLPDSIKSIKTYNWAKLSHDYFNASINKAISMMENVNKRKTPKIDSPEIISQDFRAERIDNNYYTQSTEEELKVIHWRNLVEHRLTKPFDEKIYKNIENGFEGLNILDIGSSSGELILDRLGKSDKLNALVCIDNDANAINYGIKNYEIENKITFANIDIEDENFIEKLLDHLKEKGFENTKFNFIHISMLIMHLKNPFNLLRKIRKVITKDAVIFIKDMEDRLTYAYPDENNNFGRSIKIANYLETAGYRKSGRQIYTLLRHAGFENINLNLAGINTINMDYDQREDMFDTFFTFLRADSKLMVEKYPDNQVYRDDYNWICKNYDDLNQEMHDKDFFFSFGFMIYTAKLTK